MFDHRVVLSIGWTVLIVAVAMACGEKPEASSRSASGSGLRPDAGETSASAANAGRESLTPEYLAGEWCSVYGGQERSRYVFAEDGSYRAGLAGYGYELDAEGTIGSLLEDFRVIDVERDRFVLNRRGVNRQNIFVRGPC